ncbi:MAG TPA: DUF1289 domain-containing protein [Deltaproteobacteria bacterium]|nr:MAG: DUF1289 domain-containing protein [Pseudomonadota bacterium]HBM53758.1 DUF1289 domain-containing protein [Deltaproteobacteria bacterium]|tara:strand:+ start:11127 stop:11297 length:171 start_codon:yes stop_codon:yes gene_type:complete
MSDKSLSPCCGICSLNSARTHCLGCRRSLEEIANWLLFTTEQKEEIRKELPDRVIS